MSQNRKHSIINIALFTVLFIAYCIITLFLFHRQSVGYAGNYPSDMGTYIDKIRGITTTYSTPYPIMFLVGRFFTYFTTPNHAIAVTVTGFNGLSVIILKYYFDKYIATFSHTGKVFRGILSTILVFTSLLVCMMFPPNYWGHYMEIGPDYLYRYKGIFSPNPYHNATYLAARPFSIITFFLLSDILTFYEKEEHWIAPKYIAFSIFLLLTTMTKPSFTLVLVATAGLIMLFNLINSRFRSWRAFLQLGMYFIPTFIDLLYQYSGVFTGTSAGQENGIGIGLFTAWSTATTNIPYAILVAALFPLCVILFQHCKITSNPLLQLSVQYYAVSLLSFAFLYEKGARTQHLNFAWGYMYGLFFLFIGTLLTLVDDTLNHRQLKWKLFLQWGVYILHLICGIDYFRILLMGGLYL